MDRILVVEDNQGYREAAQKYFSDAGLEAVYAGDYDEAMRALSVETCYEAAFIDCFFPKETGSNDITLGQYAMEMIFLSLLNPNEDCVNRERKHCGENGVRSMMYNRECMYGGGQDSKYLSAMKKNMEEAESNQPLGVLVAERCRSMAIPFVLTTSTYHHGLMAQPIHAYAIDRGWYGFVDSIDTESMGNDDEKIRECLKREPRFDKSSPEFWQRAHEELLG